MAVKYKNRVRSEDKKKSQGLENDFHPVKRSDRSRRVKTFMDNVLYEEYIKTRAYYLWVERGQPRDKDWDIWLDAEQDILFQVGKKKQ